MIGYYVHHVGRGHLSRAAAIAEHLAGRGETVTGLSSLDRPPGWIGEWIVLPRDDDQIGPAAPHGAGDVDDEADAGGRLHWVPLGNAGLRDRMAAVSAWIAAARPSVVVSDVSVEVALLARLHGVAVATVVLPGRRDDAAHQLGFAVSSALLSAWPESAHGMLHGLDEAASRKHVRVGAISRFSATLPEDIPIATSSTVGSGRRRVLVLNGRGGAEFDVGALQRARARTPQWEWSVVGGASGEWVDDPWPRIRAADVVVTHAGQNAIAEIAAARRPAVVMAQDRPHDEQRHTAAALQRGGWPVVLIESEAAADWAAVLSAAGALDGDTWSTWNDGGGARRAADTIADIARDVRERGSAG